MEELIFSGYKYYEVKGNDGSVNRGYSLYMLQPIEKAQGNYGYMPVQIYNRFQDKMKFPTVSVQFFVDHNIKDVKSGESVLVDFGRNKIMDFKKK